MVTALPDTKKRERAVIASAMCWPFNSVPYVALYNPGSVGLRNIAALETRAAAAAFRAAWTVFVDWPQQLRELRRAAEQHFGAGPFCRGKLSPPFWDSDPCRVALREGCQGPTSYCQHGFQSPPPHNFLRTWFSFSEYERHGSCSQKKRSLLMAP